MIREPEKCLSCGGYKDYPMSWWSVVPPRLCECDGKIFVETTKGTWT